MTESTNPNCKIILDNVPNHIDLDTISLIFENYKYCGECDLVSKSECNHTSTDRQVIIEYSHESGAKTVLNCKKDIKYKNYVFKARLFQSTPEQTEFSYDLEGFKFPFYILKSNPNLFNSFASDLNSKLNANVLYKEDENKMSIKKVKNLKQSNEEWLEQIKSYLTHFKRIHFAQKQWNSLTMDMWYLLREKAISNYGQAKDVFLLIKNEPQEYFIRIEGLKMAVEKAEQELSEQLTLASSNSMRKKMRLSNSINNFSQSK